MASPEAHSWTDHRFPVPGNADIAGADTPTGRFGVTLDQV